MAPIFPCSQCAFHFNSVLLPSVYISGLANQQRHSLPLSLLACGPFATAAMVGRRFRRNGFRHGRERAGIGVRWLKAGRRGVSDLKGGGFGGPRGGGCGKWRSGAGDGSGEGGTDNVSFLSWYLDMLQKYPLLTNSVSSALSNLLGDLICQIVVDQVLELDTKRLVVITSLGIVLVGPTLHFWFYYLNRLVVVHGPLGSVSRLLIDQFLFSPVFIGVFLSGIVTLEGRMSQIVPILQQEWLSVVLASWQFWIPFQFLNFQFVPQKHQLLAANIAALAWNVIVSFNTHKEVMMK